MKIAVMQPYLFPYLGYYQLASCVDEFVFYDDVSFIKQGYINRNSILGDRAPLRVTFPVLEASSNRLIKDHVFFRDFSKQIRTIEQAYSKAPFFNEFFPIILSVLESSDRDVTKICRDSIQVVMDYLGIAFSDHISSAMPYDRSADRAERLINICKYLDGDVYINSIGGSSLYAHDYFASHGVDLLFIKMEEVRYRQRRGSDPFIPNLSIVDIAMWCAPEEVKKMLSNYRLIKND